MPTKKGGKGTKQRSNKKKEREGSKKSAGSKSKGSKARAKKPASSAKGGRKDAAAKGGSRKAGTKKAATRSTTKAEGGTKALRSAAAAEVLKGNCLGLVEAGAIVENAVVTVGGISSADYDIDKKLEKMGVITQNQCTLIKQMILNDVRGFPCDIDDGDVTVTTATVARALRDQVKDNASKP